MAILKDHNYYHYIENQIVKHNIALKNRKFNTTYAQIVRAYIANSLHVEARKEGL
jgi:hypothetical protein